jgi:hypothetical protein
MVDPSGLAANLAYDARGAARLGDGALRFRQRGGDDRLRRGRHVTEITRPDRSFLAYILALPYPRLSYSGEIECRRNTNFE